MYCASIVRHAADCVETNLFHGHDQQDAISRQSSHSVVRLWALITLQMREIGELSRS